MLIAKSMPHLDTSSVCVRACVPYVRGCGVCGACVLSAVGTMQTAFQLELRTLILNYVLSLLWLLQLFLFDYAIEIICRLKII